MLEEKMIQLEKDYIKLKIHEEIVGEKQKLIEKLTTELSTRENDHRTELQNKLKSLEERLNDDYSYTSRNLKSKFTRSEGSGG